MGLWGGMMDKLWRSESVWSGGIGHYTIEAIYKINWNNSLVHFIQKVILLTLRFIDKQVRPNSMPCTNTEHGQFNLQVFVKAYWLQNKKD